jgi:hypothetical protein
MKHPPQAHAWNIWSPTGGVILGGGGNFRRWGQTGGRSLGTWPWGPYLVLVFFLSLSLFLFLYSVHCETSFCHMLLWPWCSSLWVKNQQSQRLKSQAKINPCSFKLFISGILSQQQKVWLISGFQLTAFLSLQYHTPTTTHTYTNTQTHTQIPTDVAYW